MKNELTSTEKSTAIVAQREPSVGEMMAQLIQSGITSENVGALKELVSLRREMQKWDAEKEFNAAFVALQSETRQVKAKTAVPNNDGTIRYKFASFEDIMTEVQPGLDANGFAISFDTENPDPQRVTAICHLIHVGGHSTSKKYTVRIGKGPPGSSESQADGSAYSYAKRGALCSALNIVIEHDNDARLEGGTITPEQAASLKKRVADTGSNEAYFLKFAGADSYEKISSAKYPLLDANLRKKEGL